MCIVLIQRANREMVVVKAQNAGSEKDTIYGYLFSLSH